MNLVAAHSHSKNNYEVVLESKKCGCFYCLHIFSPEKIKNWVDNSRTPLCPNCGVDTVIGDKSGLPITKDFLISMYSHWFGDSDE